MRKTAEPGNGPVQTIKCAALTDNRYFKFCMLNDDQSDSLLIITH